MKCDKIKKTAFGRTGCPNRREVDKMFVIDRIEKKYAVCEMEDKTMINIPIEKLSSGCKEGSCLELNENGEYIILEEETVQRKKRMEERFSRLFQK